MAQIVVLPHPELCPEGTSFEGEAGKSLCDNLLDHGVDIEHACEKSCACTTCHVIVREGGASLNPSTDDEVAQVDEVDAARVEVRVGIGERNPDLERVGPLHLRSFAKLIV